MIIKAHAKINLGLNVIERYPNGYHSLDMIMIPLELHDTIEIQLSEENEVTFTNSQLLVDENNTVVKAMVLMQEEFKLEEKFKIVVNKQIPMQAGLAGGSADAAAVLKGINSLVHCGATLEELAILGKRIGADVPFCVIQECARVKGIGEQIKVIPQTLESYVVLVKPLLGVSTKEAFELLDFDTLLHPSMEEVENALREKEEERLYHLLGNSLEQSAFKLVPEIKEMKEHLINEGFDVALMSGSGSTVFGLTKQLEKAKKIEEFYTNKGYFSVITKFI